MLISNIKRKKVPCYVNKVFTPSSIICEACKDSVEGSADEEDHSGSPMRSEWYFDPTKSCTELEQDQDHVDKPQD